MLIILEENWSYIYLIAVYKTFDIITSWRFLPKLLLVNMTIYWNPRDHGFLHGLTSQYIYIYLKLVKEDQISHHSDIPSPLAGSMYKAVRVQIFL